MLPLKKKMMKPRAYSSNNLRHILEVSLLKDMKFVLEDFNNKVGKGDIFLGAIGRHSVHNDVKKMAVNNSEQQKYMD